MMRRTDELRLALIEAQVEERVERILRGEHQILTMEELRVLARAYRAHKARDAPATHDKVAAATPQYVVRAGVEEHPHAQDPDLHARRRDGLPGCR
jgi:hypothetical protein